MRKRLSYFYNIMGQKVNPIGFRLGLTEPHKSQWFAKFSKYKYSQSVLEDHMLRNTLKKTLNDLFLKPLSSASPSARQDFDGKIPVINNITIERKFIPYQVIVSIHAQDCHLFKKKINNLKVNRELIAKMLKVRAFRFDLRNKINNLNVVSTTTNDPVFQNQQFDVKEKRLKKRQQINYIYRQRIAKDFIITKKGNTILQKLNLRKKTKKKIYLPVKYKTLQNQSKNESVGLLAIKKAYSLKKQKKNWFQVFPNQTLNFSNAGTKVLKIQIKNKTYLFKNNKYFKNPTQTTQKKYFILKKNFKNWSKKLNQTKALNKENLLKDPMFRKSKNIFQFRLFGNKKKTIQMKNSFEFRMKKKFVKIFLNKVSSKFTAELKENYQEWYNQNSKTKNVSPFSFLKKWRFAQSPIFFDFVNTLKTISNKKESSLTKEDYIAITSLLEKTKNFYIPLKKVVQFLKNKIRFKFLTLRKKFIAFGSISKVDRFAFYQVLYYFNYLNKFVNELTKIYNRQLAIYQYDMVNNIDNGKTIINLLSPLFKNNKNVDNKVGESISNLVRSKALTTKLSFQDNSTNRYIDILDGNIVSKIKKNVPSTIAITRLTRRMKLVEYIKDIIKKHRTKNLYHYLPIIAEARRKIRQNNLFIKQKSNKFFGSKIHSLIKETKKESLTKEDLKKQLSPEINKIVKNAWNFKQNETEQTAYLLKLKSILQEQQRLRKTIEFKSKVRLNFFNISKKTMDTKSSVVAEKIALALEKRQAFRAAIKSAQKAVMKAKGNIKGVKIQVSGRLNGAEMARTEWVKSGRVPLQSLSSNIDYSYRTANTIYGIIGIKVWIFKGYKKIVGYKKV